VKRKDFIGQFDSDVVTLMKKAGAIMLAITNVPELCMWWESLNNVYGRSRNPYDINRTVGGSSGGEVGEKNLRNVVCIANRDNTFDNNKIISI
jgi:fatty acid amide hydrolase 2